MGAEGVVADMFSAGGAGGARGISHRDRTRSTWCRWQRTSPTGWSTAATALAYALRLHRPWYHTLDELISERAWVRALDDAGIAVQAPVRTRDGQEYASVTIPATGEQRFAGLARWTTGRVLAEVLRETDRHCESPSAISGSSAP